jgi:hypothetical protein
MHEGNLDEWLKLNKIRQMTKDLRCLKSDVDMQTAVYVYQSRSKTRTSSNRKYEE